MLIEGRSVNARTPTEARDLGIAMVFQETSLVPTMTVAQNLYLGQEQFFNRLRGIYIAAQQFMQSLQFDVNPTAVVSKLGAAQEADGGDRARGAAQRQGHHLRRAHREPDAGGEEVLLRPDRQPEEARRLGDLHLARARRGAAGVRPHHRSCATASTWSPTDTRNFDRARIVQAMVGRDLSQTLYGQRKTSVRPQGRRVLSVQNLRMAAMVKNNSLSVFAGQITGVFGLVGSGRTETFKVVAGVAKRDFMHGGEVLLNGRPVRYFVPAAAVRDGIVYVTEDRKIEGFFETKSIADNIYLGLLAKLRGQRTLVSKSEAATVGEHWIKRLNIRAISKDVKAIELSGGNQQKVVIAKSLIQEPELIIFDEPTRGVDVGAISEIHQLINRLADEGKAVVVISSYLPEVMSLSDRILVQRMGKVVEEFSALDATEEKIMYAAIH